MQLYPGDHIKVSRIAYTHHGIYVGDNKVIHYDEAGICEDSLEHFSSGMPISVVEYVLVESFDSEEIVKRAYSRIGENKYNILFENCEHFASWCSCGIKYSGQVYRASAITGLGAIAAKRAALGIDTKAVETATFATLGVPILGILGIGYVASKFAELCDSEDPFL